MHLSFKIFFFVKETRDQPSQVLKFTVHIVPPKVMFLTFNIYLLCHLCIHWLLLGALIRDQTRNLGVLG